MHRIQRHQIPDMTLVQGRRRSCAANVDRYLTLCRESGKGAISLMNNSLMWAQDASAAEPGSAEVGRAVRIAAEASAGMFGAVSEVQVKPKLEGIELTNFARSDESEMDATNWNKAFFLNALCRNIEGLKILCGVPISVIGGSSTIGPTCRLVFSGALRLFLGRNPRTSQYLMQAMEATDPDKHDLMAPEWVLHFDTHQINLLGQVVAQSADFEERLAKALEVHKEYWSKTKDRRMDPDGFLAIELMGIAALAYGRGMRFEIESEYLPMHLVNGQFLKS